MKDQVYDNRQVRFNKMDLRPPPLSNQNPSVINQHTQFIYMKGDEDEN